MLASQVSYQGAGAYCSNGHAATKKTGFQYSQHTLIDYKLYL